MRIFPCKQYEDILDSKVIEVIEKLQVTEDRKDAKKRACSVPRNVCTSPSPLHFYCKTLMVIIFGNEELGSVSHFPMNISEY